MVTNVDVHVFFLSTTCWAKKENVTQIYLYALTKPTRKVAATKSVRLSPDHFCGFRGSSIKAAGPGIVSDTLPHDKGSH